MAYDAANGDDVKRLAFNVATTPRDDWWKVLGHVYDMRLMRTGGLLGVVLSLTRRFRGTAGVLRAFQIIQQKFPDTMEEFMRATIRHIHKGKDTTDPRSVGGWSQVEIDRFTAKVKFNNDEVAA